MFFVLGTTGLTGAMVPGMAPGPFVAEMLADRFGSLAALQLIPPVAPAAALSFPFAHRHYGAGPLHIRAPHGHLQAFSEQAPPAKPGPGSRGTSSSGAAAPTPQPRAAQEPHRWQGLICQGRPSKRQPF